jgi:hypothetical protein
VRARRVALAAVVVPALAVAGWTASGPDRERWWLSEPHRAVGPDGEGWARIDGTDVRVAALEPVEQLTDEFSGEPWRPPAGYDVWRVQVDVRSDLTDARYCEVRMLADDGRIFTVPDQVPDIPGAVLTSSVPCGAVEEGQGPPYEMWFVLPEGSAPARLDLYTTRTDELGLGPEFFALPLRP